MSGSSRQVDADGTERRSVLPGELVELLNDDCAREILQVLSERPAPARAVAAACDVSRPTAYRRLNRLESAGLVTATVADDSGQSRKRFRTVADGARLELNEDGFEAELSVTSD